MSQPLAGKRIVITRPATGELGSQLAALGATVVHVPLIEVGDPVDGGVQLRAALARLAAFDWLVVTSAHGARRAGPAAAGHPALRLAAVGPATAAALATAAGRDVDLVPSVSRAPRGCSPSSRRRRPGSCWPRPTGPAGRWPTASLQAATPSSPSSPTARSAAARRPMS